MATELGIERKIMLIRGQRVVLDRDLAAIYGVDTRRLNEQVRRNLDRFPPDFMIQLSLAEAEVLAASRSQIATLKRGQNIKHRPYAFTEYGALMLASVLRSPRAVQGSILIVRAFVRLRELLSGNFRLAEQLAQLEGRMTQNESQIRTIFEMLPDLVSRDEPSRKKIGFGT